MNKRSYLPHEPPGSTLVLLGRNVGYWRRVRAMTPKELAAQAHIAQDLLCSIEAGEHDPGLDLLDRLAEALEVTPRQLLAKTIIGGLSVDKAR